MVDAGEMADVLVVGGANAAAGRRKVLRCEWFGMKVLILCVLSHNSIHTCIGTFCWMMEVLWYCPVMLMPLVIPL